MKQLYIGIYILLLSITFPIFASAQQYIGLDTRNHSAIQLVPYNPAWVTNSKTGMEVMLSSTSVLAGSNAYSFSKKFIMGKYDSAAVQGINYDKDITTNQKHLWANLEINGPSVTYQYKDEHYIGIFTRARQIYRAGGIASTEIQLIGQEPPELFLGDTITFEKAGFVTHTFAEIGFTYGRMLMNDYYNVLRGGVTVKYLMGFVAGTVYSNSLGYSPDTLAGIRSANGDLNVMYTYNIGAFIDGNAKNDVNSWYQRAGRGSLGLDIGAQYEYHPTGNPNRETPYLFSIAASITDLGSVPYVADTGSGTYQLKVEEQKRYNYNRRDYEAVNEYFLRLDKDTLLGNSDKVSKFRIGLPTAFRFNADYNASEKFNLAVNILLNLRGNSKLNYRPGYVNYFNVTPNFYLKHFRVGLPVTVIGFQTITAGVNFQIGPLYFGTSSGLSSLMFTRLETIDGYAGIVWKFNNREKRRY